MSRIGGNILATIQTKKEVWSNEIFERETAWVDAFTLRGWLDLQSGDSKYTTHKAKLEESTHIFLCDFCADVYALAGADTRMIIKGQVYDVLLIDNPMELDAQLEISLRKVGAWDGR